MAATPVDTIKALEGRTILVGKNPRGNDLMISVNSNGKSKSAYTTRFGRVPGSVSRCKPEYNIAHCKIHVEPNGTMNITNVKSENYTFVNDMEIITKKINENSDIALGPNKFKINIADILRTASKLVVNIPEGHLRDVRNTFEKKLNASRQQLKSKSTMCYIFTAISILTGIATVVFKITGLDSPFYIAGLGTTAILTGVALIFYMMLYNMKHIDVQKAAIKEYVKDYVCPHCGTYLGDTPYDDLRKKPICPECNEILFNT